MLTTHGNTVAVAIYFALLDVPVPPALEPAFFLLTVDALDCAAFLRPIPRLVDVGAAPLTADDAGLVVSPPDAAAAAFLLLATDAAPAEVSPLMSMPGVDLMMVCRF